MMNSWQLIGTAPKIYANHSHRFLGILEDGTYVFCDYTPFYDQEGKDHGMTWTCVGYGAATKPTHYMPLPAAPDNEDK